MHTERCRRISIIDERERQEKEDRQREHLVDTNASRCRKVESRIEPTESEVLLEHFLDALIAMIHYTSGGGGSVMNVFILTFVIFH